MQETVPPLQNPTPLTVKMVPPRAGPVIGITEVTILTSSKRYGSDNPMGVKSTPLLERRKVQQPAESRRTEAVNDVPVNNKLLMDMRGRGPRFGGANSEVNVMFHRDPRAVLADCAE